MGATYTILGPGALTGYIWNDTASNLQNIRVSAAGDYHLTAFNSFGCPSSDTITLIARNQPVFSLGQDFGLCTGTSRYLVGPKDMTTYKWSNNSDNDSLLVTTSGDFWLKVTDEFTCAYTDSVSVSAFSNPVISLGNDTTINDGDSIVLTPGAGYAKYVWSTTEVTPSITVKTKATYSVTVTDQNGCEGTASIVIDTKLGVNDLQIERLKFYPNPVTDVLHVEFGSFSKDDMTTKIVDIAGKTLQTDSVQVLPGHNSFDIDVQNLPAGNYLLWLGNSKGSTTLKIVVE